MRFEQVRKASITSLEGDGEMSRKAKLMMVSRRVLVIY